MECICFDGNYLLMKAVFTLHKMNRLYGDLWNFLDNNIEKYKLLNTWENIILVSDSRKKSWRRDELEKYKGHRVRNDEIDWEWVFTTYSEWKESLVDKCLVFERDHIEGDDWITSLLFKLNKMGKSCCVISSDHDLFQLVHYKINGNKSYMNIQISDTLGKEHVYIPEGYELFLKTFEEVTSNDIFNLDNSLANINFLKRALLNWDYTEINQHQQLFEKIIQGDKSDNIDSVFQTVTKTGKLQGIGKAGASKIWDFYKENYNIHFEINEEFITDTIACIERVKKLELTENKKKTVYKNIELNIKLIQLHYKHYPEWVLNEIIEDINEKLIA